MCRLPATGPRPAVHRLTVLAAACGTFAFAPEAALAQEATPPAAAASAPAETTLPAVRVRASGDSDKTEGSGSYAPARSSTSTGLKLAPRDTPQSVSVITREQIDDQGLRTVGDALSNSPGAPHVMSDHNRGHLQLFDHADH